MEKIINYVKEISEWVDLCYSKDDLLEYNSIMNTSVEIGNHIRKLLILCSGSLNEKELNIEHQGHELHDAVIVGHLVRIYKTYDQLVYQVAENKGEIASIFSRLLFETYAYIKYFIINGNKSIDSFIRSSFRSPIKQYEFIKKQESKRELTNIEKRIISKIQNRLKSVNISPEELIKNKNWKVDGKSFSDILNFLTKKDPDGFMWSMGYQFIFANGSATVHGNWYDIQIHQLTEKNNRYLPKYNYDSVDPRYILPASFIPVCACMDYLKWRNSDPEGFILGVLNKIFNLLKYLNEMDEIRIDKRDGLLNDE